jgi:MATE family multidrug resistance protein
VRELWTIAWPLVLAAASSTLMTLGDRLVLAHYSQEAFNANVAVLPWVWTAFVTGANIAFIANVFVGRFNGSGNYNKIGPTVWQMLWFGLLLFIPLVPIGVFLAPYLLAECVRELGTPYLAVLISGVPIALVGFCVLPAFFSGRGKTKLVFYVVFTCNLLNLLFDSVLVFGLGPFPQLGIVGAAWGTVLADVVASLFWLVLFFQKSNREQYGTSCWQIDPKLFWRCLSIGAPNSISAFVNFFLWSWILQVVATYVSADNFAAFGVSHTVYTALFFLVEGVGQAVDTIDSNAYGAKNWPMIEANMHSWLRLSCAIMAITFVVMIVYPKPFLTLIIRRDMSPGFYHTLKNMLLLSWLAIGAEAFSFNLRNMLTAFEDTIFSMIVSIVCYSCVVVIPSYITLRITHNATSFLAIEAASHAIILTVFLLRYRYRWIPQFRAGMDRI